MSLPPSINKNDRVILFDGVCKLCHAWSNFIIHKDKQFKFKLCSVQSIAGQNILRYFNRPTDHFETMLYIEGGHLYQKSDAFFRIINKLGMPWKLLYVFKIIPRSIRDWIYDAIALNRYRLFGKYSYCRLPTADHENRYLEE